MLCCFSMDKVDVGNLIDGVGDVDGGMDNSRSDRLDHGHSLHPTSSPQTMPNHGFGCIHLDAIHVREHRLDGVHFCNITKRSTGGMGVDVIHLIFLNACILNGHLHAAGHSHPIIPGHGHMVGITIDGATKIFSNDRCTTCLGMLLRLQHQNSCPLPHDEPIARLIPGARSRLKVVVILGQSPAGHEPTQAHRADGGLCTSCNHYVCPAAADVVCGVMKAVICRGTCGGNRVVGTHESLLNCHQRAAHVGIGVGNGERTEGLDALLSAQGSDVGLHGVESTHPRANQDPDFGFVELLPCLWIGSLLDASLHQSFLSGHHCISDDIIVLAIKLFRDQPLGTEICNLSREFCGELLGVKLVNQFDTTFPVTQTRIIFVHVVAKHGADPHPGDHDALAGGASGRSHGNILRHFHWLDGCEFCSRALKQPQHSSHGPEKDTPS
mmetsp:Transcript_52269/g.87215  ORF Transcript_52269/g.87215 Transcript_52269/m.87215 type:complete len:439 (+) Transcript_52269:970-2286(+)